MLQHRASEGEFYIGGFVLRNVIEPVTFARCVLTSLYNLNKLVTFACRAWAPGTRLTYAYIIIYNYIYI